MTIVLTGLDIEKKARILEDALFDSLGGRGKFAVENVQLIRSDKDDPQTNDEAFAYLRVSVMDPDAKKVGKFSAKIVELGLANIPGFTATAPPTKGGPAIIHWPTLISTKHIQQKVMIEEKVVMVDPVCRTPLRLCRIPKRLRFLRCPWGR